MRTLLLLVAIAAAPCFAGRSIALNTQIVRNLTIPAQPVTQACTLQMNPEGFVSTFEVEGPCGIRWRLIDLGGGDYRFSAWWARGTSPGGGCNTSRMDTFLSGNVWTVNLILDTRSMSAVKFTCEIFNVLGNRVYQNQSTYTSYSGTNTPGAFVPGSYSTPTIRYGFYRTVLEAVPVGGAMPTTAQNTNMLFHWPFDQQNGTGSLNDISGHNYHASMDTGSPTYVAQAGQDLIYGVVRTDPHPTWTDRRTLRVGVATQLDASDSFSNADGSNQVTCDWHVASTIPMGLMLTIDDATNNCTPIVTASGFGDYELCLEMTDAAMVEDEECVHIGAVVMDEHGLVTPSDPNVTKILGPMLGLGWNPWGLADERAVYAHGQRRAYYQTTPATNSYPFSNPSWDNPQAGTIRWVWNGVNYLGGTPTKTTEAVSPTEMDIDIAEASVLDLDELPTKIQLSKNFGFNFEEIDICATTATSGAATLTVCYDGRGKDDGHGSPNILGPSNWESGAVVGQSLIKGTGTDFVGSVNSLCPAGPGPMGTVDYQTGTVSVTAGSATLTGSGTNWTVSGGINPADAVRIQATHGSVPFVFFAYITSVNSTTEITMNRVFPADADTASGLTYQIIRPFYRNPVTSFTRQTYGGKGLIAWGGTSCISDTQAFFNTGVGGSDVPAYNGTVHDDNETWSFYDQDFSYLNNTATGGINFYGESMAWRILYHRSGLAQFKETANMLDDHYVRLPSFRGAVAPFIASLFTGGAFIGAIAAKTLDAGSKLEWSDLRPIFAASKGYPVTANCNSADARDSGFIEAPVIMGANYDPDSGFRAQWVAGAQAIYNLELTCKGADNSWSSGFYRNSNGKPTIALTKGSATATGTGLSSDVCWGRASGTFSISGQTLTATSGTFLSTTTNPKYVNIVMRDASGYRIYATMTSAGGTSATIPVAWGGASTGTWLQLQGQGDGLGGMTAIWTETNVDTDPDVVALLDKNYECTYVNSTTITLERPWEGPNGNYFIGNGNQHNIPAFGRGQQPYMLAIKDYTFAQGAFLAGVLGTNFAALRDAAATFIANQGYDEQIRGMRYAVRFQSCEPKLTSVVETTWKQPGCSYGTQSDAVRVARMLNGESARGFVNNTTNTLERGDDAYGALWCSSQFNDTNLYPDIPACDANSPSNAMGTINFADGALKGGKWPGFFFGMGMAHQWPAMRLLAPSPPSPRLKGRGSVTGDVQ